MTLKVCPKKDQNYSTAFFFSTADHGQHVARNSKVFKCASQSKAIGGNDANVGLDINKAHGVEVFRVDHGAVNVGEYLELWRTTDVVAIAAGAIADNFLSIDLTRNKQKRSSQSGFFDRIDERNGL